MHNRFVEKGYSQDLEFYLLLLLTEQHEANDMTAEFSFVLQNTRIPIDEQLLPKKVVGVTKAVMVKDLRSINMNKVCSHE